MLNILAEIRSRLAKKFKTTIILAYIYRSWKAKRKLSSASSESEYLGIDSTVAGKREEVRETFNDYLRYGNLTKNTLKNKRIMEIGTGDNFGVAIKFLTCGANQVICLDKSTRKFNDPKQVDLHRALRAQLSYEETMIFDEVIKISDKMEFNSKKLLPITGVLIEDALRVLEPAYVDIIVSRFVLEHVQDLDTAFYVMDKLLADGGCMIHKIDLTDHGMFSKNGFHPLTFLTIPDPIYKFMTGGWGGPNRKLIDYYQQKMVTLNYETKIFLTTPLGRAKALPHYKEGFELGIDYALDIVSLVNDLRPKLRMPYRGMTTEELVVTGILITAIKREDNGKEAPGNPVEG